jgi:hypothetical protein
MDTRNIIMTIDEDDAKSLLGFGGSLPENVERELIGALYTIKLSRMTNQELVDEVMINIGPESIAELLLTRTLEGKTWTRENIEELLVGMKEDGAF